MKTLAALLTLLVLAGSAFAQSLAENKFFKAVEGTWKGKGTITNANLEKSPAKNRLVCEFADDGRTFTITGKLELGEPGVAEESMSIEYRWDYQAGTVEGLLAGRFTNLGGGEVSDFEVAIDEENLTAKLNQISGASGEPRIEVTNKIVDGKYIVVFSMTDSGGQKIMDGELTYDREE
ncbi:MAG: hypothetical protein ACI8UO_000517 [Verrucomicrobiales bacterium]|jgi:hypothetical protein